MDADMNSHLSAGTNADTSDGTNAGTSAATSGSFAIAIGAAVEGDEGFVGEVERVDLDPSARFATHVTVRPRHEGGASRRVPATLLEQEAGGLRLHCTLEEFEKLPADGPVR